MPTVVAYFNRGRRRSPLYARGENAADRPVRDRRPPSYNVYTYAPDLYARIDAANSVGRSPWACAEAQALSKLLFYIWNSGYPIELEKITFGRPSGYGGVELWNPCDNCLEWLKKAGGWGPDVTYRIR